MSAGRPFQSVMDAQRSRPLPAILTILMISLPLQALGLDLGILITVDIVAAALFLALNVRHLTLNFGATEDRLLVTLAALWTMSWAVGEILFSDFGSVPELSDLRAGGLRRTFHLARLLFYLMYYLVLTRCFRRNSGLVVAAIRVLVIMIGVTTVYGLYQYIAIGYGLPLADLRTVHVAEYGLRNVGSVTLFRISAFFSEPGTYGVFLACNLPILIVLTTWTRQRLKEQMLARPILWLIVATTVTNIVLTASRAAWILMVGSTVMTLALTRRSSLKLGLMLCGVFLAIVVTNEALHERLEVSSLVTYLTPGSEDVSTRERAFFLRGAGEMLAEDPLLGLGPGGEAGFAHARWFSSGNNVIMLVLGMWPYLLADTGILGAGAFAAFLIWHVRLSMRLKRHGAESVSLQRALAACLVVAAASGILQNPIVNTYLWTLLALIAGGSRKTGLRQYVFVSQSTGAGVLRPASMGVLR